MSSTKKFNPALREEHNIAGSNKKDMSKLEEKKLHELAKQFGPIRSSFDNSM